MNAMEIPIERLDKKMTEIISDREGSYRRDFQAAVERVMKSVRSVEKAAQNLAQATERAWGSITRPAMQHGLRLSDQVLQACHSLTTEGQPVSYVELKRFEERSVQAIKLSVGAFNKYIRSVVRSTKSESSVLEGSIASLSGSVNHLSQVLERSKLEHLHLLADDVHRLAQSAGQLGLKINEVQEARSALTELQAREVRLEEDLSSLSRDEKLSELDRIESQLKQQEDEILAVLEPLSKPLRKAERPDVSLPADLDKATLGRLVENPLVTLLETPVAQLRELLGSLFQSIERETLPLDQRRRRKSIEAIEKLLKGELERFRENHGILLANRQETTRQLRASGIYEQWLTLRGRLDRVRAEVTRKSHLIVDLESQERHLRAQLVAQKAKIESALKEVVHEQVSIVVS